MAKIGKRTGAKKYKKLRELQAKANRMLYKSTHIEKTNSKRKQVLAMKRQFYKSRGIKPPKHLSFRDLSPKDIKAYEKLLIAITENTYINPEKYKQFQDKMREKFEQQGYEFEFDDIKDIFDSDIISELLDLGLSPSDFWQVYNDITVDYGEIKPDEFITMLMRFENEMKYGDMTIDEFYEFADNYFNRRANDTDDVLYQ